MPAKDRYHDKFVQALINGGWTIIKEQVAFRVGIRRMWIDVQAVKPDTSPILVEIKMFERPSNVNALASAVGQYLLYRAALRYLGIVDKILYMGVPEVAYTGILSEPLGEWTLREAEVHLLVFDPENEEIKQWIPSKKP